MYNCLSETIYMFKKFWKFLNQKWLIKYEKLERTVYIKFYNN